MVTVTAYLCVRDAAAALDFYARSFGAKETSRWTDPETGTIGHAEFVIDGAKFFLADEWPEGGVHSPTTIGHTPVSLVLEVDDVDAVFRRAVDAGAKIERPLTDTPHGRGGWLFDPFGHRWHITVGPSEASAEDLQKAVGDEYVIT